MSEFFEEEGGEEAEIGAEEAFSEIEDNLFGLYGEVGAIIDELFDDYASSGNEGQSMSIFPAVYDEMMSIYEGWESDWPWVDASDLESALGAHEAAEYAATWYVHDTINSVDGLIGAAQDADIALSILDVFF